MACNRIPYATEQGKFFRLNRDFCERTGKPFSVGRGCARNSSRSIAFIGCSLIPTASSWFCFLDRGLRRRGPLAYRELDDALEPTTIVEMLAEARTGRSGPHALVRPSCLIRGSELRRAPCGAVRAMSFRKALPIPGIRGTMNARR
jgi:hypothetical protein